MLKFHLWLECNFEALSSCSLKCQVQFSFVLAAALCFTHSTLPNQFPQHSSNFECKHLERKSKVKSFVIIPSTLDLIKEQRSRNDTKKTSENINFHYRVKRDRSRSNVTTIMPYEGRPTTAIKKSRECSVLPRRFSCIAFYVGKRMSIILNIITTNMSSQFRQKNGEQEATNSAFASLPPPSTVS